MHKINTMLFYSYNFRTNYFLQYKVFTHYFFSNIEIIGFCSIFLTCICLKKTRDLYSNSLLFTLSLPKYSICPSSNSHYTGKSFPRCILHKMKQGDNIWDSSVGLQNQLYVRSAKFSKVNTNHSIN